MFFGYLGFNIFSKVKKEKQSLGFSESLKKGIAF
jgi:hypothetical protein